MKLTKSALGLILAISTGIDVAVDAFSPRETIDAVLHHRAQGERLLPKAKGGNGGGVGQGQGGGRKPIKQRESHGSFLYGDANIGTVPDDMPEDAKLRNENMKTQVNVPRGGKGKGTGTSNEPYEPPASIVITPDANFEELGLNTDDLTMDGGGKPSSHAPEIGGDIGIGGEDGGDYGEEGPLEDLTIEEDLESGEGGELGLELVDMEDTGRRRLRGSASKNTKDQQGERRLQTVNTAGIGDFAPLSCNAGLSLADCSVDTAGTFSSLVDANNGIDPIVVPCGACYLYDTTGEVVLNGLDIQGKLYVPENHVSTIKTPYVFVQGELEMSDTNPISKDNTSMRIVLTDPPAGTSGYAFTPAGSNAGVAGTPFQVGTKAFVVAGGKLTIRGWDSTDTNGGEGDDIQTWSPLAEMAEGAPPVPPLSSTPGDVPYLMKALDPPMRLVPNVGEPQQCPRQWVADTFDDGVNFRIWSGGDGNLVDTNLVHDVGTGSLVAPSVVKDWQGVQLDFTEIAQECPLIDEATYLVTIRMRIDPMDETLVGQPTGCEGNWATNGCPRLVNYAKRLSGDKSKDKWMLKDDMGNYGEWFTFATEWTFSSENGLIADDVYARIFKLERFLPNSIVYIDSFTFELPSESSYLQDGDAKMCEELVIHGDAEDNDGGGLHYYPMYATDEGWFRPLILEEAVQDEEGIVSMNKYYQTRNRPNHAHGMRFNPNPDCLVNGFVYTVSHRMRITDFTGGPMWYYLRFNGKIDGTEGDRKYPTILECDAISVEDGWKTCSGPLLITEEIASLVDIRVEVYTNNGVEVGENTAVVDWDDISIKLKSGPAEGIAVSSLRSGRWSANSDIAITPSTLRWDDSQSAVIESVQTNPGGTTTLKLEAAIAAVLTEKETPNMGVEVALLTRNIKIEGEYTEGVSTQSDGGYLQVLHTPGVAQTIEGVEFVHMGQEGIRNRHPVQFLYTKDASGSSVARNSIHKSNFRCISLDGVSGVTVSSNVAYDTAGHCYHIGFEATGNFVIGNLGAKNNGNISSGDNAPGMNDSDRATFKIWNSENDIIGNVAGGSAGRGFDTILEWRTYGEDHCDRCNLITSGDTNLRRKAPGVFRGNTAHSNWYQGFRFYHYEQFHTFRDDVNVPIFEDTKAYRNREHGIYLYNVASPRFLGGLLSDNQWGLILRVSDRVLVENYDIVGSTEIFRDHTATRDLKLCSHSSWRHEGIHMLSRLWWYRHTDMNLGLRLRNVNMSGFDKEKEWYPDCKSTEAIAILPDYEDKHWDYISSAQNVNIVDSRGTVMDGCQAAISPGTTDIVITDVDGSLDPAGNATVGALVSDSPHVTDIFGDACSSIGNCMSYCSDVCLRTFSLKVPQFGTENWRLKVTDVDSGAVMMVPGTLRTVNANWFSDPQSLRRFSVSLPAGSYTAEFLDENEVLSWPTFVEDHWNKEPDCAGFASFDDVTILKPTDVDCDELVRNGGLDSDFNTTEPYFHTLYDYHHDRDLAIEPGMGIDGGDALVTYGRASRYSGLGQDIDTRCLEKHDGEYYEFNAWVKMTASGTQPQPPATNIDTNKEWHWDQSPLVNIFKYKHRDETTREFMYHYKSDWDFIRLSRTYDPNGFNLLHGIVRLTAESRSQWEIERAPDNVDFILDNVSFTKMACDPNNLLLNGDLEEGNSKYWDTWGGMTQLEIVPGYEESASALKSFGRQHYSHGQAQNINTDCVQGEGERLGFSAKIKFELNGVTVPCNPFSWDNAERCSDILMFSNNNGAREYNRVAEIHTSAEYDDDGWYHIHGVWPMTANEAQAGETKVFLDGNEQTHDVIVDNFSVYHIPKQCGALILNPSFEDGTATYWQMSDYRPRQKVNLYSPGASGESDFALRVYDRDHHWRGMRQRLDTRCFVVGEEYSITAKFRLLDAATGGGAACDLNAKWVVNMQYEELPNCPMVVIYGHECTGNDEYWSLWNAFIGDDLNWDPDSFNDFSAAFTVNEELASCKKIYAYIHQVPTEFEIVVDDLQISSHQSESPTISPTPGETEPYIEVTDAPTGSPTSMPTVSTVTSCPLTESTPTEISSGAKMLVRSDSLCVLTKAIPGTGDTLSNIAPVGLSYDGGDWEIAAGDFSETLLRGQDFGNYAEGSHITLPALTGNEKYYLTSYSHTVSETDKTARFLEMATFGTTSQDLGQWGTTPFTTATAKEWIVEQINMPVTSHREFFRLRSNGKLTNPVRSSHSNHPCDSLSKWRRFTFSIKEGENGVMSVPIFEASYNSATDTYITIKLNGHVRTVVRSLAFFDEGSTLEFNKEYEMCRRPEEYEDGRFWLRMDDGSCAELHNPLVHFYPDSVRPPNVLNMPNVSEGILEHIDELYSRGGEYILFDGLTDDLCDQLNDVTEETDPPVFGQLPDGSWLQFDPSIVLKKNTVESPIPDGGGLARSLTGDVMRCSNAPRTFLNEEHCVLSDNATACGSAGTPNLLIELNSDNIVDAHLITGQYVYGIIGLPLIDAFDTKQPWPCEPGLRSRWEIVDATECTQTSMGAQTNATLTNLLVDRGNSDTNSMLRDIDFPITGDTCDASDSSTLVEVEIVIGSQCFRRVHPDHLSVYDFTFWTLENTHPGNVIAAMHEHPHPIKKWMDVNGSVFLSYPAFEETDTLAKHPISRWDNNSPKFSKLGRYGDTVKFVDLPNEIRLDEVAEHFGGDTALGGGGVMVCGSPFESANDPSLGKEFEVVTGRETAWDLWRQREHTWTNVGLTARDQLRQRIAWSLAQLLVVARGAIGVEGSHSEAFLGYYDIFVRNAFGNYRDVLREISYSPLMAENLSYLQSKSAAYTWETQNKISFADENFSREMMQLFSTGLIKLKLDGTPLRDDDGNTILAYTNDEIMSFARLWTGFDYQQGRANVEESSWSGNRHDPMKIQPGWRDKFPKTDMTGGYIGDGYPLCVDLPRKMFLRKGATYRLLGASHMPELMEDHASFANDITLKKFVLDSSSLLKGELCNADIAGNCQYENSVTLDHSHTCTATECDADTVRVVQVSPGIHYEYVRPPCVEQAFYANAKKVIFRERWSDSSCANPKLPYASEACCVGQQDHTAERSSAYLYDQERVSYLTAGSRCNAMGMESCDFNDIEGIDHDKKGYHWTPSGCAIQVKVNDIGQVALVYEPDSFDSLHPHIRNDNRNYFKVYWDGDYPKNDDDVSVGNSCGNNMCESLVTGGCLCDTTITESRVFRKMPSSVREVLSELTVGAYDTASYDEGTYAEPITDNGVTAYMLASTGAFDTNTVFVVTDEYDRVHRFRNTKERVRIQGAPEYAFRNAPSFMSVLNTEADARDAYYETEAALDHYFYHDNTAPFIALRLIQRFTTSNPNPRYVKAVASAFRTGFYEGVGSSKYGDLSATIAAVLLDPEARSINLDAHPFKGNLREPLLRMMALMRGMELTPSEGRSLVKMFDLDVKIGQMAHSFPTVFSFMLPEYIPDGRPGEASLVGPETMIMDMPKAVGLFNGMFALVKHGLSSSCSGFGEGYSSCVEGDFSRATATLGFQRPYGGAKLMEEQAADVVGELSSILTSGRLSFESTQLIKEAYIAKLNNTSVTDPAESALRTALQLVLTTPEFNTNNIVAKTGSLREQPPPPVASGGDYKAIVYVMFAGGCDSFNMLVPHTCNGETDLYADEYWEIRQEIALQKEDLNVLNAVDNQTCDTFGVHPELGSVQQMFNEGDLLFFANTGVLTKETDKENYWRDTETQLFAHNFMQLAAQRIDPLKAEDGTGILGRMRDALTRKGLSVGAFSIDVNTISLLGEPGVTATPMILGNAGVAQFNANPSLTNMGDLIEALNGETEMESGVFADWYSDVLLKSLSHNQLLYDTLEDKTTTVDFPDSHLGRQLEMVAKMIDARNETGSDADMFFLSTGGWDTHSQVLMNQDNLFANVDLSFKAFADELKAKNVWDSVTLIETSDFARTLTQNGGLGSDHAWGGNYIMMGGSVKGGQIVGRYPDAIKEGSPLNIGRGRIIPTTSWEAVFLPLAEWAGVDASELDYICPNRGNFPPSHFVGKSTADLFY